MILDFYSTCSMMKSLSTLTNIGKKISSKNDFKSKNINMDKSIFFYCYHILDIAWLCFVTIQTELKLFLTGIFSICRLKIYTEFNFNQILIQFVFLFDILKNNLLYLYRDFPFPKYLTQFENLPLCIKQIFWIMSFFLINSPRNIINSNHLLIYYPNL